MRPGHSDGPGRASRAPQTPRRCGCPVPGACGGTGRGGVGLGPPTVSLLQEGPPAAPATPGQPCTPLTAAGSRRSNPASCMRPSPACTRAGPGGWRRSGPRRGSAPHQRCWPRSGLLGAAAPARERVRNVHTAAGTGSGGNPDPHPPPPQPSHISGQSLEFTAPSRSPWARSDTTLLPARAEAHRYTCPTDCTQARDCPCSMGDAATNNPHPHPRPA